ncbi:hypothetical protein I4U23_020414 [Adineta vaga]|nr:hypothetical protein I4U23_020414 [Adineta vaga]
MSAIGILTSMLNDAQRNLFHFGGLILMFISTFGCLCNLIVFLQPHLRKNPCTMCFIALNVIHILYTIFSLIPAILQLGYQIDPSASNLVFCRLRYYLAFVLSSLERFCLILASIDRALATSSTFAIRKWSNSYTVGICIISLTLFWSLFHIHALIYTNILQYGSNIFLCASDLGMYTVFVTYYSLVFNGMLPPLTMIIFGILTMRNIHRVRRLGIVVDITTNVRRTQPQARVFNKKERQMAIMLLSELFIYIIFSCMSPIILLYRLITQYQPKSLEMQMIEQFISSIIVFILFIPYSINFYLNIMASKTFRKEILKIFYWIKIKIHH